MEQFKEEFQNIKNFFYIEGTKDLNLLGKLAAIALILLITFFLAKVVTKFIFHRLVTTKTKKFKNVLGETTQGKTIAYAIENTLKYVIYFFGFLQILEVLNIGRSITVGVAGIGGVAIGFGSQYLVRDFISGMFALIEDQYGIGDDVVINESISGIVEQVGMRNTKIRGFDGSITNISNGTIETVKNMSRSNQRAFVTMTIPKGITTDKALEAIDIMGKELAKDDKVTKAPRLYGFTDIGNFNNVKITIVAWAIPGEQYWLELTIRRRFLEICESFKSPKSEGEINEV